MTLLELMKHMVVFLYVSVKQVIQSAVQYLTSNHNQMSTQSRIILGLGNPTKLYKNTRHNIGKTFVAMLAKKHSLEVHKQTSKFTSFIYKNTVLALSETYMNLSAQSLEALLKAYPNTSLATSILVIDDLEHKPGYVGIKKTGSAEYNISISRGHKGVLSVMNKWRTKEVHRMKLGIGRPEQRNPEVVSGYVLAKMDKHSNNQFEASIDLAIQMLKKEGYLM